MTKQDILNSTELTDEEKQLIIDRVKKSRDMDKFLATTKIRTVTYKPSKKRGRNEK